MRKATLQAGGALLAGLLASAGAMAAGMDHAPQDDNATTSSGRPVTIDVLANDPGVGATTVLRIHRQPANGSAVLADGRVVYTPAPGFSGRDSLVYWIKTGRRFGVASVGIDVVASTGEALTLAGGIADRGAGAQVTAIVGGQRFHAQADASGRYELDVDGSPDDVVRVESVSGEVVLASIAGTMGRLRAQAGADGVLSRDENNQVQVSRLSTALAYLLQLANGGVAVVGEAQLQAAHGAIDTDELLWMAAAIKLVADGTYPLPAGVTDTLELISDTDAYRTFLDGAYFNRPEQLRDALFGTLSDPDVRLVDGDAAVAGARTLLAASMGGNIRTGISEGQQLELRADGSGRYLDALGIGDPTLTWTFVDGMAQGLLAEPRSIERSTWMGQEMVREIQALWRVDLSVLVPGGPDGRDLVAVARHYTTEYPDLPERPMERSTHVTTFLGYTEGVVEVPFVASEFPGIRALPLHSPEVYGGPDVVLADVTYALHQFNAGGSGTILGLGEAFSWWLHDDGRLVIHYADGEMAKVRRLFRDGRKGDGVLSVQELPGGREKVMYSLSSVRDGSLVFDTAGLVAPWRSGFDITRTAYDAGPLFGLYMVLEAGGRGSQVNVLEQGWSGSALRWSIVDGAMVARRYRNDRGFVEECTIGVDGCVVFLERRWVPLSRDGDRIYVHEELWMNAGTQDPHELYLISQRANFYDNQVPPLP